MASSIQIGGHTIRLSNLDKVLYPDDGITKGDVIDYYREVAGTMLPHLADRPLTLRRFPDGIDEEGFFQKEASHYFPDWVRVVDVSQHGQPGTVRHAVCDDEATLVYLANQASLELHVPLSRLPELENPDRLVIDLDPPDDVRIGVLREVARAARKLFETVGLVPFVQTTGGRGFHVAAPLDAKSDYDLVHPFARRLADRIAARRPDELTTEQRKDQRGQRVFLDTNRNAYAQTTVAPYSPRARAGAPAATPLDWSELSRVTPDAYGLGNLGHRLARKADPWADFDKHARSAAEASQRLAELD